MKPALPTLTAREREVAGLIALSDKEVAARLNLSLFTVRAHWRSIIKKSGRRGRVAVALWLASSH